MRLIGLAVVLAVSLTLAPLAAETQQAAKVARIGWLAANPVPGRHMREAFLQGLRDLGCVEGRSIVKTPRGPGGKKPAAGSVLREGVCRCRGPDGLWTERC